MSLLKKISNFFRNLRDKRQFPRKPLNFPVQIKLENLDQFFNEYITDISAGGVFIVTPNPFERGSVVDIEFSLKEESKHFFKVRGVVVRVQDAKDSPQLPLAGMGIKFIEITEQSRDLMKDLLQKISKESLPAQ